VVSAVLVEEVNMAFPTFPQRRQQFRAPAAPLLLEQPRQGPSPEVTAIKGVSDIISQALRTRSELRNKQAQLDAIEGVSGLQARRGMDPKTFMEIVKLQKAREQQVRILNQQEQIEIKAATVKFTRDKILEKIKAGRKTQGALKPPSQAQSLAAGFAIRIQQSERIFEKLEKEGFDLSDPQSIGAAITPERFKGSGLKRATQAQRNFVNATLRRESGAAISDSEFDNAEKQYFLLPGDGPKVRAQKKENRRLVLLAMQAEARGELPEGLGRGGTLGGGWTERKNFWRG